MSDNIPIAITLPWAVVVRDNGSAKFGVAKGRMILTRRYRDAKQAAHYLALGAAKGRMFGKGIQVRVRIDVYPPDNRRRDIANLLKFTLDALTGAVYADDSQIERLEVERCAAIPTAPQLHIRVDREPYY